MITFRQILNELALWNSGVLSEAKFIFELLDELKRNPNVSIKGAGRVYVVEMPYRGQNVVLYKRGGNKDGTDYFRKWGIKQIVRLAEQASKSDIIINSTGYSIKSFLGDAASVANKINRINFIKLCHSVGISDTNGLVRAVDEHHRIITDPKYRNKNVTRTTVRMSLDDYPYSGTNKDDWLKLISALTFERSPTRISRNPAEYVISICPDMYDILSRHEYEEGLLNKVIIWLEKNPTYFGKVIAPDPKYLEEAKWSLNIRLRNPCK